jgi:hypothetical protein
MAIKQLSHLDFKGHQIQNASIHPLVAAPSSPRDGQAYFDTTLKCLRIWNADGNTWQDYTFSEQLLIKKSYTIGDGTNTSYVIAHNMGTSDLTVLCYDRLSKDVVDVKSEFTDDNSLTVSFGQIPAVNEYRVVLIGGYGVAGQGGGHTAGGTGGSPSDLIQNLGSLAVDTTVTTAGGRYIKATLAGNILLNLSAGISNTSTEHIILELTQDSPGARILSWGSTCKFPSGIAPVLSTDAGTVDLLDFVWNGTYWYLTNFIPDVR